MLLNYFMRNKGCPLLFVKFWKQIQDENNSIMKITNTK